MPHFRCSSLNFELYFSFNHQRQEQQTARGWILPSIHQRWRWRWEGLVVRRQSHPRRKVRSGLRHLHRRPRCFSWQLDGSCCSSFRSRASLPTKGSSSLSLSLLFGLIIRWIFVWFDFGSDQGIFILGIASNGCLLDGEILRILMQWFLIKIPQKQNLGELVIGMRQIQKVTRNAVILSQSILFLWVAWFWYPHSTIVIMEERKILS